MTHRYAKRRSAGIVGGVAIVAGLMSAGLSSAPSVSPPGPPIYPPDKPWSGYTVFITPEAEGVIVIDMNGRVVKQWTGLSGVAGGPARVLPGGAGKAGTVGGAPNQESLALVQLDWDGKEVWRFDRTEQVKSQGGRMVWSARQHHDWQRPSLAAGYYAPGMPAISNDRTLLLTHSNVTNPKVSDRRPEDDRLIEGSQEGKGLWDWRASDHADELGFSDGARAAIRQAIGFSSARDSYDWLHINAASYVGPNLWRHR